jgi:hypothetical protein
VAHEVGNGSRSTQRSHPGARLWMDHLTIRERLERPFGYQATQVAQGVSQGVLKSELSVKVCQVWYGSWLHSTRKWHRPRRTQLGGTAATQAQEHKVQTIEDEIAVKEAPCSTDQWWLSSTSHLRQQLIFVFSNSQRYHEGMAPSCL